MISKFLNSDSDYLIVREKDLEKDLYDELISQIIKENSQKISKIIIHSHIEIAKKHGISKVHFPEYMLNLPQEAGIKYSYSIHPTHEYLDEIVNKAFFVLISPAF